MLMAYSFFFGSHGLDTSVAHEHGFPSWYGKGATPYDSTHSKVDASTTQTQPDGNEVENDEDEDVDEGGEKCEDPKSVLLYIGAYNKRCTSMQGEGQR